MKLVANIDGKEYKVVQGATFSEDYNETLDSASIILSDEFRLSNLKPYDDVLIYSTETPYTGVYTIGQDYYIFSTIEEDDRALTGEWINIDYESSDRLTLYQFEGSENFEIFGPYIDVYADYFFNYTSQTENQCLFKLRGLIKIEADVKITSGHHSAIHQGIIFTISGSSYVPLDEQSASHGINNTFYIINDTDINKAFECSYNPDSGRFNIPYVFRDTGTHQSYYLSNIRILQDTIYPYQKQIVEKNLDAYFDNYPEYLQNSLTEFKLKINYYRYKYNSIGTLPDASSFAAMKAAYGELYKQTGTSIRRYVVADSFESDVTYYYQTGLYTSVYKDLDSSSFTRERITPPLPEMPYYKDTLTVNLKTARVIIPASIGASDMPTSISFIGRNREDFVGNMTYSAMTRAESFEIVLFSTIVASQQTNLPHFFKHYLVDNFNAQLLNLTKKKYKYKIALFSETKGLEKIVCPNLTITQPLEPSLRRSCWFYLEQYLRLYSPKVRISLNNNKWIYKQKYVLDPSLEDIFGQIDCPEMSFTAPTLRELLSKIMSVKDCIPVVRNNTVSCIDVSKRNGEFLADPSHVNYLHESMTSAEYATVARREHSGAISQDHSTRCVEYLSFRSHNTALMTIDDLELETRFPIYKINKIMMCYYKKFNVYDDVDPNTRVDVNDYWPGGYIVYETYINYQQGVPNLIDPDYDGTTHTTLRYHMPESSEKNMLVKQDITKLVLQSVVRNAMAEDWTVYQQMPDSVDALSKFKVATVGYNIGSNKISGWGTTYSYYPTRNFFGVEFASWFQATRTYVENIFNIMDELYPFGANVPQVSAGVMKTNGVYFREKYTTNRYSGTVLGLDRIRNRLNSVVSPFANDSADRAAVWTKFVAALVGEYDRRNNTITNVSSKLKSFFFEIDYNAMNSSAIEYTKEGNFEKEIMTADNCSSSLTVLEADGIFEKEKMNRIGNKTFYIQGRYDDYDQMDVEYNNVLGAVYKYDGDYIGPVVPDQDDVIIFHREYSIFDHEVMCNFLGMKDYVLRNYFTSVFAKYRTYNYMSYNESVNRTENVKQYIAMSFDKLFYETETKLDGIYSDFLLTAFQPTNNPNNIDRLYYPNKVNIGYFTVPSKDETQKFVSDVNCFISGGSLNFNFRTFDNITNGVYIYDINADGYIDNSDPNNPVLAGNGRLADGTQIKGSVLQWYLMPNNTQDPYIGEFGCYVANYDTRNVFVTFADSDAYVDTIYKVLFKMPLLPNDSSLSGTIGNVFTFGKDNKEVLDVTFQIEPLNLESDIVYSDWFLKLNDVIATYNKWEEDVQIQTTGTQISQDVFLYNYAFEETYVWNLQTYHRSGAALVLKINRSLTFDVAFTLEYDPTAIFRVYKNSWDIYSWIGGDGDREKSSEMQKGFYGYVYDIGTFIRLEGQNIIFGGERHVKFNENREPDINDPDKGSPAKQFLFEYLGTDGTYNYYEFKDIIMKEHLPQYEYTQVSCGPNMTGNSDYTQLNSDNSIVNQLSAYYVETSYKTYYKNFYVATSTNPVNSEFIHKTYKGIAEIEADDDGFYLNTAASVSDVFDQNSS